MWVFLNRIFFLQGGVVSSSPNPQAGGPPLVGCPRLLIQLIRSYPPYRRPFLYPQPEDAPCRDDRDPLHSGLCNNSYITLDVLGYQLITYRSPKHYTNRLEQHSFITTQYIQSSLKFYNREQLYSFQEWALSPLLKWYIVFCTYFEIHIFIF